jgi:AraC-like DNA-binding protein
MQIAADPRCLAGAAVATMTTFREEIGGAERPMNPAIQTADPHVTVRLLYPFAAALRDEGADLDLVLAAAQIPRAIYDNQDSRIPITTARRFHSAAAATSRDPALGLTAARHFAVAQFQLLEYVAATSSHVGAALDTLVKSERALSDFNAIRLEPRAEGIFLRVEPLSGVWHRCFIEFAVGAIYLAGRRILRTQTAASQRAIPWFAYPASTCAAEYELFFRTGARFDAPASGLLIPRATLKECLQSADAGLHQVLDAYLSDLTVPNVSLLERARALVRKSLPGGDSCVDAIATSLHMSPTTLRRRLRQEGVTHRSLVRDVRRDLAVGYLQRQDISIDEVAYLVGYDDTTAFHKAFKKWTGNTPAQHRALVLSGHGA